MSMRLSTDELPNIYIQVRMHLIASPVPHILHPLPLIFPPICVHHDPLPIPFLLLIDQPEVNSILILLDMNPIALLPRLMPLHHILIVQLQTIWLVLVKEVLHVVAHLLDNSVQFYLYRLLLCS